jgi:MoxR-like ATPase
MGRSGRGSNRDRRAADPGPGTPPVTTTTTSIHACQALQERLTEVIAMEPQIAEQVVVALLAHGHVLIEGIPGIGKTLLARTLAAAVEGTFHRIQFTNDLMPSDIVGSSIWRPGSDDFRFVPGPLFANFVLADEINRTSPRTLSCLLEAMEQGLVSVEGKPVRLADPFFVIATRNPIEFQGTFPVPEAALDRFLIRIRLGYPEPDQELALYRGRDREQDLGTRPPVLDCATLAELVHATTEVEVSEPVAAYAYRIVHRTREHPQVQLGASPRAALMWLRAARARALLHDRSYVVPDDLKQLAIPVLSHRVFTGGGAPTDPILGEILSTTPVAL